MAKAKQAQKSKRDKSKKVVMRSVIIRGGSIRISQDELDMVLSGDGSVYLKKRKIHLNSNDILEVK